MRDEGVYRLKAATRDAVRACGGVKRAGEIISVSTSEMSRLQDVAQTAMITVAQAAMLEAECGVPYITQVMADLSGRRLTDPTDEGREAANLLEHNARVMKAVAEGAAALGLAYADGEITAGEAERLYRQAAEAEDQIRLYRASLASLKARGPERIGEGLRVHNGGRE